VRILLVEDDRAIAHVVGEALAGEVSAGFDREFQVVLRRAVARTRT